MDFVQDIIIPSYALQTPSYLCVLVSTHELLFRCCMIRTDKVVVMLWAVTRRSGYGCGSTPSRKVSADDGHSLLCGWSLTQTLCLWLCNAEKFYMDLHEEIRFRVTNINFTRVTKTAKGAFLRPSACRMLKGGLKH